jgi:hypothetical protein
MQQEVLVNLTAPRGKKGLSLSGKRAAWGLSLLVGWLGIGVLAVAGPPGMIDYQGQVVIQGEPYDGNGYFKLAISGAGSTNAWTHNGTSVGVTDPPAGCITNIVSSGVFSMALGDPGLGMPSLAASIFATDCRYLRVWFSTNAEGPFVEMLPARRLVSVPYALHAGSSSTQTLSSDLTTAGHWISGDGDTEGIYVDSVGNVGVGTESPSAKLHVSGAARFDQGITFIPELGDLSMGVYTNH